MYGRGYAEHSMNPNFRKQGHPVAGWIEKKRTSKDTLARDEVTYTIVGDCYEKVEAAAMLRRRKVG
uniref:Uncharacterized protein n=1 Tax=Romanomermis culicivorax TaxID=13658 RepID=A0A915IJ76_ROMCU